MVRTVIVILSVGLIHPAWIIYSYITLTSWKVFDRNRLFSAHISKRYCPFSSTPLIHHFPTALLFSPPPSFTLISPHTNTFLYFPKVFRHWAVVQVKPEASRIWLVMLPIALIPPKLSSFPFCFSCPYCSLAHTTSFQVSPTATVTCLPFLSWMFPFFLSSCIFHSISSYLHIPP